MKDDKFTSGELIRMSVLFGTEIVIGFTEFLETKSQELEPKKKPGRPKNKGTEQHFAMQQGNKNNVDQLVDLYSESWPNLTMEQHMNDIQNNPGCFAVNEEFPLKDPDTDYAYRIDSSGNRIRKTAADCLPDEDGFQD